MGREEAKEFVKEMFKNEKKYFTLNKNKSELSKSKGSENSKGSVKSKSSGQKVLIA